MIIQRDLTQELSTHPTWIQILLGPRQCGKSTLLSVVLPKNSTHKPKIISFDDFTMRRLANQDPELFLQQFTPPLLLNEVQYVPNLFPALKKVIDQLKLEHLKNNTANTIVAPLFQLTGSNQILMDKNVKESFLGRATYYHLNTLTVHEILAALPQTPMADILFRGGLPELYTTQTSSPVHYLNDYVRSYVEKDIVLSAGIQKTSEFNNMLGMLAARTGQMLNCSNLANDSGIKSVTVKEWINVLERTDFVYLLKPYSNNLNKLLTKTPKIFFLDTGIAVRLQGWSESTPLMNNPQIGSLFETLVLAEIVKFIRNYRKNWELFFWHTRTGEEIDFLIQTETGEIHALDAKLSLHNHAKAMPYPPQFQKQFSPKKPLVMVTFGGESLYISKTCMTLPIAELHDYLRTL